jgi:hypothetical protein
MVGKIKTYFKDLNKKFKNLNFRKRVSREKKKLYIV